MIFMFFGHPGAGKTTLVRRFGELHGILGIDTDQFMTEDERLAAARGSYTPQMRQANIRRYAEYVQQNPACRPHVALADGLPTNTARRFLLDLFPEGSVVLVLVQTERSLWEQRLTRRTENPVEVGIDAADAYIRANWEQLPTALAHERIENSDDAASVDVQLRELWRRHLGALGRAAGQ